MKLPAEVKEVLESAEQKGYPCVLATASKEGKPNIGLKASMMAYDDESLAYWERTKATHMDNIQANPSVAIICWDGQVKTGYRFMGTAEIVNDGKIREELWERVIEREKKNDPNKAGVAIIIKVSTIIPMGKAKQTWKPEP